MLQREFIEDAMRRSLALARRGPAEDPNPQVGCVLLDPEGRIVAEGWHLGSGTPHAEIAALAQLPAEWRGRTPELTAVVTLEPCNHTGRTGPCAEALIDAGVGAVAYALDDPGALSGGGAERLRAHGVETVGGILSGEARAMLAPWLARQGGGADPRPARTGLPHITVKWAQTLDGRAAAADGSSRWITGPEARADVHRRRAEADAILVGTGTLIADDPALTARGESGGLLVPAGAQPVPVVVGHRGIPEGSRVLDHPALAARGLAAPVRLPGDDLAAELATLGTLGIRTVLVEGGPSIASSLIAAGLADEVLVYVAPALLGGPRLALGDIGVAGISGIQRLRVSRAERLGDDLLVRATVDHADRRPASARHDAPGEEH